MLQELFDLKGRSALITGGSQGIGLMAARGLALAGADIMIAARHEEMLARAVSQIADGTEARVVYQVADMTDRSSVDQLAAAAVRSLGKVDILLNNAGSNEPQSLAETTDDGWDRLLELNLTSCMRLSRALVPGMIERKWGRMIHVSSIMALASGPGRGVYSATKAALVGMARAHALELGPHGITVNCLAPGPVLTDLPQRVLSPEQRQVLAERTALKRWGDVRDMVGPVLLLASDAGAYITGSVLLADGGLLCRAID